MTKLTTFILGICIVLASSGIALAHSNDGLEGFVIGGVGGAAIGHAVTGTPEGFIVGSLWVMTVTESWLSGTATVIIGTGPVTIGIGGPGRIAVTGITMENTGIIPVGKGTGDVTCVN